METIGKQEQLELLDILIERLEKVAEEFDNDKYEEVAATVLVAYGRDNGDDTMVANVHRKVVGSAPLVTFSQAKGIVETFDREDKLRIVTRILEEV